MKLTVAICTWNRAPLLQQTLEAMTHLRVPAGASWELIVVNNNCTDGTDDVVASYIGRLPLRPCHEPTPGLSRARNHAVRAATGDYILWTDDDVLVDESWLESYHRAFRRWQEAAVFGGRVDPWMEGKPPSWLVQILPRVGSAFATVNLGNEPLPLGEARLPFGANMAIRTTEQRRHLFDPDLGVGPNRRMGGEETAVIQAILAEGHTGWWLPDAKVQHYIPEHRQTVRYLRSYFSGYGEYCGREIHSQSGPRWFGQPRWVLRRLIESEVRYRLKCLICRPGAWIDDLISASTARGILRACAARGTAS